MGHTGLRLLEGGPGTSESRKNLDCSFLGSLVCRDKAPGEEGTGRPSGPVHEKMLLVQGGALGSILLGRPQVFDICSLIEN